MSSSPTLLLLPLLFSSSLCQSSSPGLSLSSNHQMIYFVINSWETINNIDYIIFYICMIYAVQGCFHHSSSHSSPKSASLALLDIYSEVYCIQMLGYKAQTYGFPFLAIIFRCLYLHTCYHFRVPSDSLFFPWSYWIY